MSRILRIPVAKSLEPFHIEQPHEALCFGLKGDELQLWIRELKHPLKTPIEYKLHFTGEVAKGVYIGTAQTVESGQVIVWHLFRRSELVGSIKLGEHMAARVVDEGEHEKGSVE